MALVSSVCILGLYGLHVGIADCVRLKVCWWVWKPWARLGYQLFSCEAVNARPTPIPAAYCHRVGGGGGCLAFFFFFLASAHGEGVRYLDLYIFWE